MQYKDKPVRFYVILTVDCKETEYINKYAPPARIKRQLTITEGNDQRQYDYLGRSWENHKHRKYVGELSFEDFSELTAHCWIFPEDVETMGSLTVEGWLPAISFEREPDYYNDGIVNAYVTPFVDGETLGDDDWKILRQKILDHDWA